MVGVLAASSVVARGFDCNTLYNEAFVKKMAKYPHSFLPLEM